MNNPRTGLLNSRMSLFLEKYIQSGSDNRGCSLAAQFCFEYLQLLRQVLKSLSTTTVRPGTFLFTNISVLKLWYHQYLSLNSVWSRFI